MELEYQSTCPHPIIWNIFGLFRLGHLGYGIWLWYSEAENSMGLRNRWIASAIILTMTRHDGTYS